MNGYELIALTNGNLAYFTRIIDYILKHEYKIITRFSEVFLQAVLAPFYLFVIGVWSDQIVQKYNQRQSKISK